MAARTVKNEVAVATTLRVQKSTRGRKAGRSTDMLARFATLDAVVQGVKIDVERTEGEVAYSAFILPTDFVQEVGKSNLSGIVGEWAKDRAFTKRIHTERDEMGQAHVLLELK